jgi:hypothetical protein
MSLPEWRDAVLAIEVEARAMSEPEQYRNGVNSEQ